MPNYWDPAPLAAPLAIRRDKVNLKTLRERLPDWIAEKEISEEVDANEATSASIDVDAADTVTVGSGP